MAQKSLFKTDNGMYIDADAVTSVRLERENIMVTIGRTIEVCAKTIPVDSTPAQATALLDAFIADLNSRRAV